MKDRKEQKAENKTPAKPGKTRQVAWGVLIVAVLGTGAWFWHAAAARSRVAHVLPPLPDLTASSDALRDRLAEVEAEARSLGKAQSGLRELARVYHANGFLDQAVRVYAGLRQLEPKEARWPHLEASIHAGFGDLTAALPLWRQAVQLAPDYIPARIRLGDALLKMNDATAAAATYEEVLRREPDNSYALFGLARIDLEAERWDQARARLEQVVRQTNYGLGYDLIVSLYERLGLTQRAVAIRARVKASGAHRDPPDPWLDSLINDCLDPYRLAVAAGFAAGGGDPARGRQLLERALEVSPDDVSARFQLGLMLITQGDAAAAQGELERCIALDPTFADPYAHLSSLQAKQGRAAVAEQTLAQGLKRCPDSPGLHLMMARTHRAAGRNGPAAAEFRESIRLRPNEPDAYLELGQLLVREGRNAEGLAEFQRALVAEPGNPTALVVLAFSAITTGTEAEARAGYARAARQPRIDGDQLNSLAGTFQKRFGRAP